MTILRFSKPEDYEDSMRMAYLFFEASPYKKFGIDEDRVSSLILGFIHGDRSRQLSIVLEDEGKLVGIFAAAATENLFNNRLMTAEVLWWIEPSHRNLLNATKFIDAYEYWAQTIGAQLSQLVSLDRRTGRLYEHKNYVKAEYAFIKEF